MKVITSFTLNWDLEVTDEQSFEYDGPVAECKGGANGVYYESLGDLYAVQADQARTLGDVAKRTVLPGYERYLQEAQGYGSQANQEKNAQQAGADAEAAAGGARASLEGNLASLGINPADQRYATALSRMETQGAAQKAAAMSGARDQTRKMGMAYTQDAISLGMGTPTQAASAAQGAGNTMQSIINGQNQQSAQQANGIAGAVRGGLDLYGAYQNFADGGYVNRAKYARGGIVNMRGQAPVQAPPTSTPAGPSTAQVVGQGAAIANKGIPILNKAGSTPAMQQSATAARYGTEVGSQQTGALAAQEQGMNSGMSNIWEIAKSKIDSIMPKMSGMEGSAMPAADVGGQMGSMSAADITAGTAGIAEGEAAGTAAGGVAAAEAGSAAGAAAEGAAAAETAYAGATAAEVALEAAPLLLLAADGGRISPQYAQRGISRDAGGEVDGPGGPKDDKIPAMLSDGEFVMPIGTVKKYGLAKLEKMRQEGLMFEEELGIRKPQEQKQVQTKRGIR